MHIGKRTLNHIVGCPVCRARANRVLQYPSERGVADALKIRGEKQ